MNTVLTIVNILAATIIVVHGVFTVINSMGRETGHGLRLAWAILTTGSLGVMVGPLFGRLTPGPSWTCMLVGVALAVVFDRRRPGHLSGTP